MGLGPLTSGVDAIKDCARRSGLVLDPFCGGGTVLIAAERTGRSARAIELDPAYVDAAVRRWPALAGKRAVLAETGGRLIASKSCAARLRTTMAAQRLKPAFPGLRQATSWLDTVFADFGGILHTGAIGRIEGGAAYNLYARR